MGSGKHFISVTYYYYYYYNYIGFLRFVKDNLACAVQVMGAGLPQTASFIYKG
jgi:hypothetical protein